MADSDIKLTRYKLEFEIYDWSWNLVKNDDGEWVRWEDVKPLLEATSKIPPKIDIDSGSVDAMNKGPE